MKKNILFLLLPMAALLTAARASAQPEDLRRWEFRTAAGYNLGGSTPIPLPAEIRKIRSWNPGLSWTLAFLATRRLSPRWGIASGLAIDVKGMTIEADVKYLTTLLDVGEGEHTGSFSGMYTGRNRTKVRNGYLTIPLLAVFCPNKDLNFRLGGYFALLRDACVEGSASDGYIRNGGPAGDRIHIERATFDFSEHVRKTDAGLMAQFDRLLSDRLSLTGQLSWGLTPLFPSSFRGIPYKMYNIYFTGGIAYTL
jgi:hypothetical protein